MKTIQAAILISISAGVSLFSQETANWPQFRGPLGTGAAPAATPPTEWSETKNVRWKTPLPGMGHSSPIVWGDRIFLTSAIPVGEKLEPKYSGRPGAHNNVPVSQEHQFIVLAVDRSSGKIVWQTKVHERLPHEGGHETGTLASASPVTDGKHVYAFFGSNGLYCLDFDGKIVWQKRFGDQFTKHGHGEGSSPALHGDFIAVNWDHEEQSRVIVLNKKTGELVWEKDRDEKTSWATPIVIEHEGTPQLVVSGTTAVRGYDMQSGEVIWQTAGLSNNVVASPVAEPGFVYAASSYEFQAILAIKLEGASGDISKTDNVIWRRSKRSPYVPSPLLYKGVLFYLNHYQGVLSRVVGKTGEEPTGPFRLPGLRAVYASPVAAADKIYLVDRSGVTVIVSNAETPKPIAANQLEDRFSATPALVDGEIILRGEKFLYSIAELEEKK